MKLPPDILGIIVDYIDIDDYINLLCICKDWLKQFNKIKLLVIKRYAQLRKLPLQIILSRLGEYKLISEYTLTPAIFDEAARYNQFKLVQQLWDKQCRGTLNALTYAIKNQNQLMIQWLQQYYGSTNDVNLMII